jgi:futalosine hydrolase
MKLLLVAATREEILPFLGKYAFSGSENHKTSVRNSSMEITVLLTGVGMIATVYMLSRELFRNRYDLIVNAGIAGSFRKDIQPGSVVHVISDTFAELGAEDHEEFLTIDQLGLRNPDQYPFREGQLQNPMDFRMALLNDLPSVKGITVNKVHGRAASISTTVERFSPDVESMEGAAFMYTCMMEKIPFLQIRAVSNFVEPRNRKSWQIQKATENLNITLNGVISELKAVKLLDAGNQ